MSGTDFFRDIKKRHSYRAALVKYPNLSAALPGPTATVGLKCDADHFGPIAPIRAGNICIDKTQRMMRPAKTAADQSEQQCNNAQGA